ncbi:hypothetical protein [Lapidilactobacillus wuchangensis]|uniref:hypothetical protein n=1 Tax=Lapidilactobacillus wuchangensis TaxID=2486001 RepID=UPI000F777241|nr:hypothetical protein [Lapidilactobacillus wuchangensis]
MKQFDWESYLRHLRQLIPAVLFVWLFTHLQQTSGLDLAWRWTDAYLLVSFLGSSPLWWHVWQLWQARRQSQRELQAEQQVKQMSAQHRRGRYLDRFFTFCGRLALNLLVLAISPLFAIYWLLQLAFHH